MALQNMLQRAEAPQERVAPLAIMDGSVAAVAQEVRASNAQLSEAGHVASPAVVGGVENGVSTQVAVPPSVVEKSQVTGAAEVEGDLLRLAEMHYEHALPQVLQPQEDSQSVRKGAEMQPPVRAGMKKPAAAKGKCSMKKPAVSVSTQQQKRSMKKPASSAETKLSGLSGVLKRPAAAAKGKSSVSVTEEITRAKARKLRPSGCGKCRYKPGRCPSCWAEHNVKLLDF